MKQHYYFIEFTSREMKENFSGLKTLLPKVKLEARGCMEESKKMPRY